MLLTNPFKPDPRVYDEAKALVDAGYKVTILCWDRGENYPSREMKEDIEIIRIKIPSSYGKPIDFLRGILTYYFLSIKYLKNKNFDIVHAHDFDTLPLAYFLKKLHEWKVIYDAHDHYTSMIKDVLPSKVASLLRFVEEHLMRRVDGRIAATRALGHVLFGNLDFVTVMNAKKLEDYDVSKDVIKRLRDKYNLHGKFVIVYIGILKIWEPIPQIIEAVKGNKDIYLIIGGDGPHRNLILKKVGDADNILYIGWVKKEDIPKYTALSDIIILPSDNRKEYTRVAVGNKIMEGLAAGKPIIAGKGTEGGRIVEECQCGLVCEFTDIDCISRGIRYLKENKNLYEKFAKNARFCAEKKYNWGIMKERLLQLYARLEARLNI